MVCQLRLLRGGSLSALALPSAAGPHAAGAEQERRPVTSLGFRSLGEERRAQRALKLCGDIAAGPGLPLCPPISVWMATLLKSSGTDLHRGPFPGVSLFVALRLSLQGEEEML